MGHVLHLEGSDAPLTIASAAPVDDGPGWRLLFREVPDRAASERLRDAYLEIEVDRYGGSRGRGRVLARGHRLDGARLSTGTSSAPSPTSIAPARPRSTSSAAGRPASSTCRRSGPSSGTSRPKRGEIVIDEAVLDLGGAAVEPSRAPPAPPRRRGPPRTAGRGTARAKAAGDSGRQPGRRRADPATVTLEIDVLTLFPAMLEGPLAESIPGRIAGARARADPGPRPARVGPRAAPQRR